MGDLAGQAALVTGAAQGIGFGIARELARAGSRVIIADRNLEGAQAAVKALEQEALVAIALTLDVTDAQSVSVCVSTALETFVHIDILVNNAGVHCERIGEPSTAEHFGRCLDVNLVGIWRMAQALLPHFKQNGGGRIVNIASVNGRKPWADTPAYSASKAAAINLTQSLAMTFGPHNINVNAVCPGGVMTPMANQFLHDLPDLEDEMARSRVLKRALLPEDIGHAVVFLVSPHARNITGQSLNVDGGGLMS